MALKLVTVTWSKTVAMELDDSIDERNIKESPGVEDACIYSAWQMTCKSDGEVTDIQDAD